MKAALRFKTLSGRSSIVRNVRKYKVDWDGKSKSKMQKAVRDFLRPYWKNHLVFEEFPMAGTRNAFDFYNATKKVVVEAQGVQHYEHVKFFHGKGKAKFIDQIKRDQDKFNFCDLNGIALIEVVKGDELTEELFDSMYEFWR